VGVATRLAAELGPFFGMRLLERNAHAFGRIHQLGAGDLQQTAVGMVGNRLVLHRAVHNHAAELFCLDQLELDGHVDGLRQQCLHAFLAQQLAELDQGGGVAGLAVFVVSTAREELPTRPRRTR